MNKDKTDAKIGITDYMDNAKSFFEEALHENMGPAYLCPYIDPTWNKKRILEHLALK